MKIMEEIPEDSERDAIIDAMFEELRLYIRSIFVAISMNPDETNINMVQVYEECLKYRMQKLFMLAVQRATLYDR